MSSRLPPESYAHYWGGGKKRREPGIHSLLDAVKGKEALMGTKQEEIRYKRKELTIKKKRELEKMLALMSKRLYDEHQKSRITKIPDYILDRGI